MEDLNFVNTIVEVVISIVGPLVVVYATNRKTAEESKFFSYITLGEENFVKKTRRKSNKLMIVFLALYLAVGLNGILYSLPINENVLDKARIVGLLVLSIITIGQSFCNFILAFLDVEYLDEKMRKQKRDLSNMDEWINFPIMVVCVAGFGIILLCRKNVDTVSLIAYSIILITVGMEAVYNSFISLYVKIRCWYHVKEIIFRTKTTQKVYNNIFNYRKDSEVYEFVCEEESVLKRIRIPVDEVESIERKIEQGKTYLDIMREKEVNIVEKKNKKKGFWCDFASQNKAIVMTGAIAVIYCIVCVIFKGSAKLNVNENIYPWGEFLFSVAISVIAAVIFFIVQVFIPNRKKERTLRKYAKRHLKEMILSECNILKIRTEMIRKGEKSESEMKEAINSNCMKIKRELNECLNKYLQVLPEELIEAMNSVLFDDMFYMICIRANGILANESLEKILQDQINYNFLWDRVEKIKIETENL